jgi:7-cyano-7-deazaguanine tRNA-ribosyltransferase
MQTVESSHRDRRLLPQVATFEVLSHGTTRSRAGILTLGTRSIQTPVVWLGHTLKSRVRFISDGDLEPLPILMSFAEFRDNGTALDRSRRQGLHRALEHAGPILLDSGGYAFQKRRSIDLCPNDLTSFYEHSGADIGVALDHPLSPAASRRTNARRWLRSLENLAMMQRAGAPYLLMPVVHGYTIGQVRLCCEKIAALVGTPQAIGIGSMVPLLKASHIGGQFRYRRTDHSIGDHVDFVADAIHTVKQAFPNAMLHVFGAGGVPTALALFAAGADSCDSAGWRLKASFGAIQLPGTSDRYLQRRDSMRTRRLIDKSDIAAISACGCPACKTGGKVGARRALLRTSFSARATHNAHVITTEVKFLRNAILAQRDHEWLSGRLDATHRFRRLIAPAAADAASERLA